MKVDSRLLPSDQSITCEDINRRLTCCCCQDDEDLADKGKCKALQCSLLLFSTIFLAGSLGITIANEKNVLIPTAMLIAALVGASMTVYGYFEHPESRFFQKYDPKDYVCLLAFNTLVTLINVIVSIEGVVFAAQNPSKTMLI